VAFRAEVVFRAKVPPILVEARRFLCAFRVSADSLLYNWAMVGSRPYDFYEPLPGVFLSQPSSCYAEETKPLASSLLKHRREVSELVVAFPL